MTKRAPRDLLARQIREELSVAVLPFGAILGEDIGEMLERVASMAPLIAQVLQSEDDKLIAREVSDLLRTLWPNSEPPPEWWRTPLGQACAGSLGRTDEQSVTRSVAAAMLGVHPGTVAQMVHRGTLDKHPDGSILRSSVLLRIHERGQRHETNPRRGYPA